MNATTTTKRTRLMLLPSIDAIEPHYHPIVDLRSLRVIGYEVLSRFRDRDTGPGPLFEKAHREGCLWELEMLCREAALADIAALDQTHANKRFFLNVSPFVISDERFSKGFTKRLMEEFGIDVESIVFEITERESIHDHEAFAMTLKHYTNQGFEVAMDDFGAGNSGLITLVATSPQYVKLDMSLVRDIHLSPYKQHLVRSLCGFANNVGSRLIAEGVETEEELACILRLGVRFAQGYLFGKPAPLPMGIRPEQMPDIERIVARHVDSGANATEAISSIALRSTTVPINTHKCEDIDALFRNDGRLDHFVLVDNDDCPQGMVTRADFYRRTGGPLHYHLYRSRPIELLQKAAPLIVNETMRVTTLAKLAMERPIDEIYEPVVVTKADGKFVGTVTIRQLVTRAAEIEIHYAQGSNPLTALPGNHSIEGWLHDVLNEEDNWTVIYADLDRFKEFNDAYGFLSGDALIRTAAEALLLIETQEGFRLGHIGGDDFVIVGRGKVRVDLMTRITQEFDNARLELFNSIDTENGYYLATNRSGVEEQVPLVTVSLAILEAKHFKEQPHPSELAQAASDLKKAAKRCSAERGESSFLFERRVHVRHSEKLPRSRASSLYPAVRG